MVRREEGSKERREIDLPDCFWIFQETGKNNYDIDNYLKKKTSIFVPFLQLKKISLTVFCHAILKFQFARGELTNIKVLKRSEFSIRDLAYSRHDLCSMKYLKYT